MNYIQEANIFESIQIIFRYINRIEISTGEKRDFNVGKYFNTNVSYKLSKPLLRTTSKFEFISNNKKNRIIGINTDISGHPKTQNIVSVIQTTGVNPLEKKIKLNNSDIFNEIKSTKEELKEVFFDIMTDETKNKIMEAQYYV